MASVGGKIPFDPNIIILDIIIVISYGIGAGCAEMRLECIVKR